MSVEQAKKEVDETVFSITVQDEEGKNKQVHLPVGVEDTIKEMMKRLLDEFVLGIKEKQQ